MARIAEQYGPHAVDLKGKSKKGPRAYATIQAVTGACNCKYVYANTCRHQLFKVSEWRHFQDVCDWLHQRHRVDWQDHFDEVVANIYSRAENECAGFHTDQSELLGNKRPTSSA